MTDKDSIITIKKLRKQVVPLHILDDEFDNMEDDYADMGQFIRNNLGNDVFNALYIKGEE